MSDQRLFDINARVLSPWDQSESCRMEREVKVEDEKCKG